VLIILIFVIWNWQILYQQAAAVNYGQFEKDNGQNVDHFKQQNFRTLLKLRKKWFKNRSFTFIISLIEYFQFDRSIDRNNI